MNGRTRKSGSADTWVFAIEATTIYRPTQNTQCRQHNTNSGEEKKMKSESEPKRVKMLKVEESTKNVSNSHFRLVCMRARSNTRTQAPNDCQQNMANRSNLDSAKERHSIEPNCSSDTQNILFSIFSASRCSDSLRLWREREPPPPPPSRFLILSSSPCLFLWQIEIHVSHQRWMASTVCVRSHIKT